MLVLTVFSVRLDWASLALSSVSQCGYQGTGAEGKSADGESGRGAGEEKMKTKRGSNESGRKLIMYKKVMVKIVQWVHFAGGKLGSWLEK